MKRNLLGQKIGMLTVVEETGERDYKGSVKWKCICSCGAEKVYSADSLLHGGVVSCGCYKKQELGKKLNKALHRIDGTCIEKLGAKRARVDSHSGHAGIILHKNKKASAYIGFKGKRYYLGTFNTMDEAIEARKKGEQIHESFLEWYYSESEKQSC